MKKKSLLLFPLVCLFFSTTGCSHYVRQFTLYCDLNGGSYSDDFLDNHSEGEFAGKGKSGMFRANINLNNYTGAMNIMPSSGIQKDGKVFAGWYFKEGDNNQFLPSNVVSELALSQIVMNYDNLEKKSADVYARWLDPTEVDVFVELDYTKVNSKSTINKYADYYSYGASFNQSYLDKVASKSDVKVSGKVFRKTYDLGNFTLDSLYEDTDMPMASDVSVESDFYTYHGPALWGMDYDKTIYSELELCQLEGKTYDLDTQEVTGEGQLLNALSSVVSNNQPHQYFLKPQYFRRPIAEFVFKTNYITPGVDGEFVTGVPGEFTDTAIANYNSALIVPYSTPVNTTYECCVQKHFTELDPEILQTICPTKDAFEPYDADNDYWDDFNLDNGWELLKKDVSSYEKITFTLENLNVAEVNSTTGEKALYGVSKYWLVTADDFVYPGA